MGLPGRHAVKLHPLKLVTIVVEAVLDTRLRQDLLRLGAKGYTCTKADGEGSRGMRTDDLAGKNLRFETVVSDAVAERILTHLAEQYFPNYAVVAYVQDVSVVRGDKYV